MATLVKSDNAIGLDETCCRMLMPQEDPIVKAGELKAKRQPDKIDADELGQYRKAS